jgi:transposase InsO family protein
MLGGKWMFLLVIDDMSRYMWLVLLATKDEATSVITHFRACAEAEARCKVGMLRTNRVGEFTTKEFMEQCTDKGIQCHLIAPYIHNRMALWRGVAIR